MNTAKQVSDKLAEMKAKGMNPQQIAWELALLCVGWAYVFGARGEYCDPSNRRRFYRDDHPTIKSKCQNFDGSDSVIGKCASCKWYPGGRTRVYDCRGFTYWILKQVYGWVLNGAGATSQWNNESNWKAKGTISDGVPKDTLVCLFVQKGKTMEHTGLGFNNETIECSSGVQHFTTRNKKWTHWAIPACIEGEFSMPEKEPASSGTPIVTYPTIKQGAKGEIVTQLQSFLAIAGSNLQIDGIFGSGTRSAVQAFQRKYGLTVDGIVGPKTWTKLLEVAGNIKVETPEKEQLVTLVIPDLKKTEADDLMKKYPRAQKVTSTD